MNKQDVLKTQTCVLRVNIHCDGCKSKVRKILQKIDGVYTVSIDVQQGKVTVTGNVDPLVLMRKLEKSGKHAEMWSFQKGSNNNKSNQFDFMNSQFKNTQVGNGKGGGNDKKSQQKGGKDQQKGGGGGGGGGNNQQVAYQQFLQQMKGSNDLQVPFNMKNQKSVKFNMPSKGHGGDDLDEFDEDDDFDDDEFVEEFDDYDDEIGYGGYQHQQQKTATAIMGNGHGHNNGKPGGKDKKGSSGSGGGGEKAKKGGGGGNGKKSGGLMSMIGRAIGGKGKSKGGNGGKNGGGESGGKNKGGGNHNLDGGKSEGENGGGGPKNGGEGKTGNKGGGGGNGGGGGVNHKGRGGKKGGGGGKNVGFHDLDVPNYHIKGGGGGSMGQTGHPMGQMGHQFTAAQNPYPAQMMGMGGEGGGYYPGMGSMGPMPGNPYQQQQYMAMMNQQRMMHGGGGGGDMYHPAMYGRLPPGYGYAPPMPPPAYHDPLSHVFSDENPGSCSIM